MQLNFENYNSSNTNSKKSCKQSIKKKKINNKKYLQFTPTALFPELIITCHQSEYENK
jgi:hypothetical protein